MREVRYKAICTCGKVVVAVGDQEDRLLLHTDCPYCGKSLSISVPIECAEAIDLELRKQGFRDSPEDSREN